MLIPLVLISGVNGLPQISTYLLGGNLCGELLTRGRRPGELTEHRSNLLREGAHTALTSIFLDDQLKGSWCKVNLLDIESMLLGFLGQEMLLCDL